MNTKKDVVFEIYLDENSQFKSSIHIEKVDEFPALVKTIGYFVGIACKKFNLDEKDTCTLLTDLTATALEKYSKLSEKK